MVCNKWNCMFVLNTWIHSLEKMSISSFPPPVYVNQSQLRVCCSSQCTQNCVIIFCFYCLCLFIEIKYMNFQHTIGVIEPQPNLCKLIFLLCYHWFFHLYFKFRACWAGIDTASWNIILAGMVGTLHSSGAKELWLSQELFNLPLVLFYFYYLIWNLFVSISVWFSIKIEGYCILCCISLIN
jgi:hypothetical protein